MEDQNSPENVAKRASQEDPIVMYLVVRESLNMGVGKTAAQCAHASQMLLLKYMREVHITDKFRSDPDWALTNPEPDWVPSFKDWLENSFRKVVLRADDKEWEKLKEIPGRITVIDAGLTEIASGSETVMGFLPMKRSLVPKTIKKLQALK